MTSNFDILSRGVPARGDFKTALEDAPLEDLLESLEERAIMREKSAFGAIRAEVHRRNGWGGCPVVIDDYEAHLAKRERAAQERAHDDYMWQHATPIGRQSMLTSGYRPPGAVPVPATRIFPMKQPSEKSGAGSTLAPIQAIKVADIVPDPNNRKNHDATELSTLAASIKRDGLLQAIIVRPIDGGKYMLIAGERRWLAHKELQRAVIEARVSDAAAGAATTRKRLAENFHRVDLSPIEKAKDLAKLEADGMSQKEIADFVGAKDQSTVSNFIRLLKLPKTVQAKVHAGELSAAHAKAIARFERWPAVCEVLAGLAIKENTPSKDLEQGIPFTWQLKSKKLIVEIETTANSWDNHPAYVVSEALQKDPDFVKDGKDFVCFAPDKWAPHKATQDAEYAKKQKASEKREASQQSTMSPADRAKRAKTIADNKRARIEAVASRQTVLEQLRDTKDIAAPALAVVAQKAFESHWRIGRSVKDAAAAIGLTLPKGFDPSSLKWLEKLKPVDLLRLCAGAIVADAGERGAKFAWPVKSIEEIAHILGDKKTKKIQDDAASKLAGAARAKAAKKGGAK